MNDLGAAVAAARPRVVAALAARLRDLDAAEDAFSEAVASALTAWRDAPPYNPAAWLWRASLHRAFDARRRAVVRQRAVLDPPAADPTPEDVLMAADEPIPDERLRLIFICCHPAVAVEVRAALTLKIVCGLPIDRLARAFLASEPAMLQRITRAKRKIAAAGVPFEAPGREHWAERLDAVLATLEIAYAQAYEDAALAGDAAQFAAEVQRLTGLLVELLPHEPEVLGLAALVRFAEARRPARLDAVGAMVPPHLQDTALWRQDLIDEGVDLLLRAARLGWSGPRQLMAAIHAAHLTRQESGETPWSRIAELYDALLAARPTPVTLVNRAVAIGEARGAAAGLEALAQSDADRLAGWLPFQAARASLLAAAGRANEAQRALTAALALDPPPAERLFLERRLRELDA